jgi:hypothetical protein
MVQQINGLPDNVAGFKATGIVTKEDFDQVIFPVVQKVVKKFKRLNFLMVMDTEMKNFTLGAWLADALVGLKHLSSWNRLAFVSDEESVKTIAPIMDKILPGKYKAFSKSAEADAINWVSENPPGA